MQFLGDTIGPWDIFGFLGNICFGTRFVVQWIASERAKKTVMPLAFWYLSIVGTIIFLIYSIHLGKLVVILAFLFNIIPYTRNVILTRRERQAGLVAAEAARTGGESDPDSREAG